MTLKTLAKGKVRVNLSTVGPRGQVFGTIYTVPALKAAFVKEILIFIKDSASGINFEVYVLPSGVVDLTAIATDVTSASRGTTEDKGIDIMSSVIPGDASVTNLVLSVLGRNTLLEAGDKINIWVHYGATTPGQTDVYARVSGDEFTP